MSRETQATWLYDLEVRRFMISNNIKDQEIAIARMNELDELIEREENE